MYVGRAEDLDYSEEAYIDLVLDEVPEYLEEHESRINEALENNPEEIVFKTTLEPGEGRTESEEP